MRLIELGLRHHIVAAAGACREDLKFGGAYLGARDVEGLLRVVERLTRGVAVPGKCRGAVERLLRIQEIGLRLCQRFARRRQCQFIKLPHPRFGLGDRALRLHHRAFSSRDSSEIKGWPLGTCSPSCTSTSSTVPVIWLPISARNGVSTWPLATTVSSQIAART